MHASKVHVIEDFQIDICLYKSLTPSILKGGMLHSRYLSLSYGSLSTTFLEGSIWYSSNDEYLSLAYGSLPNSF